MNQSRNQADLANSATANPESSSTNKIVPAASNSEQSQVVSFQSGDCSSSEIAEFAATKLLNEVSSDLTLSLKGEAADAVHPPVVHHD